MKVYIECKGLTNPMGVVKAHIDEGINQVTMIDLELASRKELPSSDLEKLIGEPIKLVVEDIIDDALHKVRRDGFIFEMIDVVGGNNDNGVYFYTMVVRPRLWRLNYHVHSRSYTSKSRIEVIDELLKAHDFLEGVHFSKSYQKEEAYPVFNQLLQTGHTDLVFFKSLLGHAGINYYFSCDDAGEKEEMLHLLDYAAFFPNYANEIPIVSSGGLLQETRRVAEITRLTRAVPSQVVSTVFLGDGSTRPASRASPIEGSGMEGIVNIFVPEGLQDAEKSATQSGKVVSEGFLASRIVHQGVGDHVRVRPGWRITLKDQQSLQRYKVLVVKAHHTFEQSVLAALSESGSGDAAYKNHFIGVEPMAPMRPMDLWTEVDTEMVLASALDLNPEGKPSLSPKYKYVSRFKFNPENEPRKNTAAVKELMGTVSMLQAQARRLTQEVTALKLSAAPGGGGMIAAEVIEDAWVTDGKELVCRVKAEEFQDPIVVKVSATWHTTGGGTHLLPRVGKHVWIERVLRGRDNEWVMLGYRPTGKVTTVDPAHQTKIKRLGEAVSIDPAEAPPLIVVPSREDDLPRDSFILESTPPVKSEDPNKPYIVHVRLIGAYFDTNKCFLLPTAIGHIKALKEYYDQHPESDVLVVGHTDASGEPSYNDPLSLERAKAMAAYMSDDVEAWYSWYGEGKPWKKRWGSAEDRLMIKSMPDYATKPAEEDAVHWYQRTREAKYGLAVDGVAGKNTRKALIEEYMNQDGTTLPEGSSVTTHGCGENFPLPEAPAAWDRHSDQEHRRVEFFFFKKPFGIDPAPPGKNSPPGSTQYPTWCRRANERHDLSLEARGKYVTLIEMHDALFRSNSCVVLPEGEDPTKDEEGHLSLTTVGLVASVLRYDEEHPDKKLLVAGHCDTTNTAAFNQPLSEERAGVAHAMLVGDRDTFIKLCDGRHDEVDVTQIFDWTTRAYGFSCKPTRLDAKPSDERYRQFRESYNQWIDARDPETEPDSRGGPALAATGRLDQTIWGAIFDLYEHNLRQETGETAAGVAELRQMITWVDPNRQAMGFSEHHPVDNLGRDNYRSQANRRVEVLFFDPDEQPDLSLPPEMSDIYLPGYYEREHLPPRSSALDTAWFTCEPIIETYDTDPPHVCSSGECECSCE